MFLGSMLDDLLDFLASFGNHVGDGGLDLPLDTNALVAQTLLIKHVVGFVNDQELQL